MEGWGDKSTCFQLQAISRPDIILFLFFQDPRIALFNGLSLATQPAYNIEFSCRPARSHVPAVLENALTVIGDLLADNCNDLLDSRFAGHLFLAQAFARIAHRTRSILRGVHFAELN